MKVKYKNTVVPCPMLELRGHVEKNFVQTFDRKNRFI